MFCFFSSIICISIEKGLGNKKIRQCIQVNCLIFKRAVNEARTRDPQLGKLVLSKAFKAFGFAGNQLSYNRL